MEIYFSNIKNKGNFSHIYSMDSKNKSGDVLALFCQEFWVPERFTFDGSKDQPTKGTTFMTQVLTDNIDHFINETDLHNQNLLEGFIR